MKAQRVDRERAATRMCDRTSCSLMVPAVQTCLAYIVPTLARGMVLSDLGISGLKTYECNP